MLLRNHTSACLMFSIVILTTVSFSQATSTGTLFKSHGKKRALKGHVGEESFVSSLLECGLLCLAKQSQCKSFNYVKKPKETSVCQINDISLRSANAEEDFVERQFSEYFEPLTVENKISSTDNKWTLVARFSNNDTKNWMEDNGTWWYDRHEVYGQTQDPGHNGDMISEHFWLKNGSEFRITRSDDPTHTALLTTTGDCLGGQTFRLKLASYGKFRGNTSWASDKCLGNCSVTYGGSYSETEGFSQAKCDGSIQKRNQIGFWCDFARGDGAVLMIGGGGDACKRADHGIGITDQDDAGFKAVEGIAEHDFGSRADAEKTPTNAYSLNLWVC